LLYKNNFPQKCDVDLCQNIAEYSLCVGKKGKINFCEKCLDRLYKTIKLEKGETNGRKKVSL